MVYRPRTGFDTRQTSPPTRIAVSYGQYITLPQANPTLTKQAVVLGALPGSWQWDHKHPVHMICHSQGGNTVRLLIELLSGRHGQWNPTYFASALGDRQDLVKSVVTLGTPYLGTTITNVIFDVSFHLRCTCRCRMEDQYC
jgi:triacylglycerol esterase/lipase EstA (alpha/beta hydrolase family)